MSNTAIFYPMSPPGTPGENITEITVSPRVTLPTSQNWAGPDINYGFNYFLHDDDHGGAATPAPSNLNFNIPQITAGSRITGITLVGRTNNDDVGDIEFFLGILRPTDPAEWQSGITAVTLDEIIKDRFIASTNGTVNTATPSEPSKQVIPLDHTVLSEGGLYLAFRATSVPAGDRLFYTSINIGVARA